MGPCSSAFLTAALVALPTSGSGADVHVTRVAQGALLTHGEESRELVWGRDIEATGLSGDGEFHQKPLIFAGYGVRIPGGYDDLAGLELKGRVVVIARVLPDLEPFAGLPERERSLLARLRRLEEAKAVAVLILESGSPHPLRQEGAEQLGIPVLSLGRDALGSACGDLQGRLKAIRDTRRPASQDFIYAPWTTLTLKLKLRREAVPAKGRP